MQKQPLRIVTIRTLIAALIISVAMYAIMGNQGIDYILAFLYGILIILVNFFLIAFSVTKIVDLVDPKVAKKTGSFHFVIRSLVFALMFILGIVIFKFNWLLMFLGTIVLKVVIHLDNFYHSVKVMKMW
ncbi:MAG: ATP synthase subunit I [Erysipelotrichaceae bacterium]